MTAPKRCLFRFGLRTMFVVVTACALALGWLTWNIRQMRNREQVAQSIEQRGGELDWGWIHESDLKRLPALWQFLGAEPMFNIRLPAAEFTRGEAEEIRETFPESFVYRYDPAWETLADQ